MLVFSLLFLTQRGLGPARRSLRVIAAKKTGTLAELSPPESLPVHSMMQISPPLPSLTIRCNVSWNFSRASMGIR